MKITHYLLETLSAMGEATIEAFFPKKYPYTKLGRLIFGLEAPSKINYEKYKKTFSATLSRLQKQGLVQRTGPKKKSIWILTPKGEKFVKTKLQTKPLVPSAPDGKIRIVSFDIPEKEKNKRNWLRSELVSLGYKKLHKSVWIGKTPLPEELLQDIEIFGLTKYIHILSIKDKGTLD